MRIAAIIPTVDRPAALRRALHALSVQTVPPEVVVVCPPDRSALPADLADGLQLRIVDGVRGASAQRNLAVAATPDDIDLMAFLDDDTVLRSDYLEQSTAVFSDPGVVGVTGRVARNGAAEGHELDAGEIDAALEESRKIPGAGVHDCDSLYGCNMVVRAMAVRATPFDERLALYSWLEDLDFSRQLRRWGRLVTADGAVCVHQGGASGGRVQHLRFGYSQIANVVYLRRKGSINRVEALRLIGPPVASSLIGAIHGKQRAPRRLRLRGMWMAAVDIAHGRITPERIEEM